MQTDMHYYGTYALARAAGINKPFARTIATAAEYVDDSDRLSVTTTDGILIESEPTAHHPINGENLDPFDQRRTWVPFHFIPGNEGATQDEKLVCCIDSDIAREMISSNMQHSGEIYGALLIGITAHVYADTFAHYGFSGISSIENQVEPGSITIHNESQGIIDFLTDKASNFVDNYVKGPLAGFIAKLGHGSVATYPDQPYLSWSFIYEKDSRASIRRNNPETFLLGCRKLHAMFCEYNERTDRKYYDDEAFREFEEIEESIKEILEYEGDVDKRIEAWQREVQAGSIFNNPENEPIPVYDSGMFTDHLRYLSNYDYAEASDTLVFLFLKAANIHRKYVLEELLPKYDINVNDAHVEWVEN